MNIGLRVWRGQGYVEEEEEGWGDLFDVSGRNEGAEGGRGKS